MNSAYGKTIQKEIKDKFVWLDNKQKDKNGYTEAERYIVKNYYKLKQFYPLPDSDIMICQIRKPIDEHYNFSLLGIQVLSMSKRIMNEVMCLAFDEGCHIYYQDTDSVHIEANDLPHLEEAFEQKYHRPLRGNALGQFHSDFPKFKELKDGKLKDRDEVPWSIESYFVMKKLYVDKLQDSTGEIQYMRRGKGLTQESINIKAEEMGGFMNLYKALYETNKDSEGIVFDLAKGVPSFEFNRDAWLIKNRPEFKRKIKSTYKEGIRRKYFEYANGEVNEK